MVANGQEQIIPIETPLKKERLGTRDFANSKVERIQFTLEGNKSVLATVVRPSSKASFDMSIDPRFLEMPIVVSSNGLIDQKKTLEQWQTNTVGMKPEQLVEGLSDKKDKEVLAFDPTNWGWALNEVTIVRGQSLLIPNDRHLNGTFQVIGKNKDKWTKKDITYKNGYAVNKESGQIDNQDIKDMEIGFSVPLLIEDGKVKELDTVATHPRLLADLRNVFDFAGRKPQPPAFWESIRDFLPFTKEDALKLATGKEVVTRKKVTNEEMPAIEAALKGAIESGHIQIQKDGDYLQVKFPNTDQSKLPLNNIPATLFGYDKDGQAMVILVDGRQPDSKGATIPELAQIAKTEGMVTGGLGAAGGDVVLVAKEKNGEMSYFNSPSNTDQTGKRFSRPMPSVMAIS
jgi:hypothetical protein